MARTMSPKKRTQTASHRRYYTTIRARVHPRQRAQISQRLPLPTQQPTGRHTRAGIPTTVSGGPHPRGHTVPKHLRLCPPRPPLRHPDNHSHKRYTLCALVGLTQLTSISSASPEVPRQKHHRQVTPSSWCGREYGTQTTQS